MDKKDRPLSREKKVTGGTAHVGRREGAGRPPSAPTRPSVGMGGSFRRTPTGPGAQRSGGRRSSPLSIIIVLAVLLLGGGGGLSALLGGSGGSSYDTETGTSDYMPPTQSVNISYTVQSGGDLDTTVSQDARAKRTVLKGDGMDTTTVMVYMCGTDLESKNGFATTDIREMTSAEIGDKLNVIVFTGGCTKWQNSVISSSKNQIYQVKEGGLSRIWESSGLQPMTDPGTLSGFIQWGVKNAPADRYELIFWDHGGGSVSGYGYDEAFARSGSMTLDGIAKALKDGGCVFDFVGFDACLMATLETALVVEPYADYLIASEETEPGCGWYYTDWLTNLSKAPSRTALELGRDIADSFVSVCASAAPRQQATLSVIDLAELCGTVPEPFKSFAQSTNESIKADDYQSVAAARGKAKEFAASSNIDQVDLIDLADNLNTRESRDLAEVLRGAVKYNATSNNIQNANGVSIYFPYGSASSVNKMAQIYDEIGLDESYTDCIKSFASLEVAGQSIAGGNTGQISSLFGSLLSGGTANTSSAGSLGSEAVTQLLGALLSGSGRSLSEVGLTEEEADFLDSELVEESGEYLTANQFDASTLAWTEQDGQNVLVLTEAQWDLVQDIELNVFVDDGQGYIDLGLDNVFEFNDNGDLIGDYDRTWLSVDGQIAAYYMLSNEGTSEDYKIMGRIPALLNGQNVDLIVSFTDEYPDGEILGAAIRYDGETETETIAKGLLEIQYGDVIDLLCGYYDYDRNFREDCYLGEPLIVSGPLEIANIQMDNTSCIAAYRLTDIYNNHYWTPSV